MGALIFAPEFGRTISVGSWESLNAPCEIRIVNTKSHALSRLLLLGRGGQWAILASVSERIMSIVGARSESLETITYKSAF